MLQAAGATAAGEPAGSMISLHSVWGPVAVVMLIRICILSVTCNYLQTIKIVAQQACIAPMRKHSQPPVCRW